MAGCKDRIIFNSKKFIADFKSLCSSPAEVANSLQKAGLNRQMFYIWRSRSDSEGNCGTSETTLRKLCSISGLVYEDYFIRAEQRAASSTKKSNKSTVHSYKTKNGVRVTTYSANLDKSSDKVSKKDVEDIFDLHKKIASFKSHLIVYRKLLGLSSSDMKEFLALENYSDIEDGRATMSISTYIAISAKILEQAKTVTSPQIKSAFNTLAGEYNDIYLRSVFFGDM